MRRAMAVGAVLAGVVLAGATLGAAPRPGAPAPEIAGDSWINGGPLTMAGLRGRVVAVEFWTYGCINCRNVIPHLRAWSERYGPEGLVVVGVHAPEFPWERPRERVAAAVRELSIRYPVVQDNDFATWERYGVRAWPTLVLVDRRGIVRFQHIGEGAYAETEAMIRRLLAEGG